MIENWQELVRGVPRLRRYARVLSGSQAEGDRYVETCLETVLERGHAPRPDGDSAVPLFRLFHEIHGTIEADAGSWSPARNPDRFERNLLALPALERQVLVLVAVEQLSIRQAARVLSLPDADIRRLFDKARTELNRRTGRILIIDHDAPASPDLADTVRRMGHTVVATAQSNWAVLRRLLRTTPNVILTEVTPRAKRPAWPVSSGILSGRNVPVIVVTEDPDWFSANASVRPVCVVPKPVDGALLEAAIDQALAA